MNSVATFKFIQIGIIVITLTLSIIRVSSKNFTLTNLITCVSLMVAIFILLLTVRSLVEKRIKLFWKNSRIYAYSIIDILMLIVILICIPAVIGINYLYELSARVVDTVSILALGISMSNNILSEWCFNLLVMHVDRKGKKSIENEEKTAM